MWSHSHTWPVPATGTFHRNLSNSTKHYTLYGFVMDMLKRVPNLGSETRVLSLYQPHLFPVLPQLFLNKFLRRPAFISTTLNSIAACWNLVLAHRGQFGIRCEGEGSSSGWTWTPFFSHFIVTIAVTIFIIIIIFTTIGYIVLFVLNLSYLWYFT